MIKVILLAIAICILATTAFAVPEKVATGPYQISFDLGLPKESYEINISESKEKETIDGTTWTEYGFKISKNIDNIIITIDKFQTKQKATPELLELTLKSSMLNSMNLKKIESATRPIDNTTGAICSGEALFGSTLVEIYGATYLPPSDQGNISVMIASTFPWEQGTLQLLKTIHIEKVSGYERL